jgi:hypothetical protein
MRTPYDTTIVVVHVPIRDKNQRRAEARVQSLIERAISSYGMAAADVGTPEIRGTYKEQR